MKPELLQAELSGGFIELQQIDWQLFNFHIVVSLQKKSNQLQVITRRFRRYVCHSPSSQLLESVFESNRPIKGQKVSHSLIAKLEVVVSAINQYFRRHR